MKVADFGIARAISDSADQNLTKTGSVMGTATYFSPEQAQGAAVDPRSDLYSLGVVLYEMITGRPPFTGDTPVAIAYKHVQENPVPPAADRPRSCPRRSRPSPSRRWPRTRPTATRPPSDLQADLRRYLDGNRIMAEPVLAPPVDPGATGLMAPTAYGNQTALVAGPVTWQPGDEGYGYEDEYAYDEEQQPKRSRWFLIALILLLLLLAGLLFLLANTLSGGDDNEPEQVTVRNVVGQPIDAAEAALKADGFEVTRVAETSDQPPDTVIKQDPGANTKADEGSTVTLTFSSGPEQVAVPDVVGKDLTEASRLLTEAGLVPNAVPVESDEVDEGLVVTQNPPATTQVAKNSQVTIEVSSGNGAVAIPNVAGSSEAEARTALGNAGFTNIQKQEQASDSVAAGSVISTDPAAGAEVNPTEPVVLVVSTGASKVSVPSVQNLSEANARSALEGVGLVANVQPQAVANPTQDGIVITQAPSAGAMVDKGSSVTIFVGKLGGGPPTTENPD